MTSMSDLPNEILHDVVLHLYFDGVLSSMLVNRRFYAVIKLNWKRINKQIEVKKLTISRNGDHTELSLISPYSGNVKLLIEQRIYPGVHCIYDVAVKDTALVRAVTHYAESKASFLKRNNQVIDRAQRQRIEYQADCPIAELRDMLMHLLPLIDFRKLHGIQAYRISPTQEDCITECMLATDCSPRF